MRNAHQKKKYLRRIVRGVTRGLTLEKVTTQGVRNRQGNKYPNLNQGIRSWQAEVSKGPGCRQSPWVDTCTTAGKWGKDPDWDLKQAALAVQNQEMGKCQAKPGVSQAVCSKRGLG